MFKYWVKCWWGRVVWLSKRLLFYRVFVGYKEKGNFKMEGLNCYFLKLVIIFSIIKSGVIIIIIIIYVFCDIIGSIWYFGGIFSKNI